MTNKTTLHIQVDADLLAKLSREQERLAKASPGTRVTVSDTVRSLLERALRGARS